MRGGSREFPQISHMFSYRYASFCLHRVRFDVYVSDKNVKESKYICSTSKLRGNDSFKPIVESRICSRFK